MKNRKRFLSIVIALFSFAGSVNWPTIAKANDYSTDNYIDPYLENIELSYIDVDNSVAVVDEYGDWNGGNYYAADNAEVLPDKYQPDVTKLPQVANQSPYGTCWAFSSIALAELSVYKQENKIIDASELQLAYFTNTGVVDPLGGTNGDNNWLNSEKNFLNNGGNLIFSMQSFASWKGAAAESTLPYSKAEDSVTNGLDSKYAFGYDIAHLRNAYILSITANTNLVKKYIMEYGGVGESYYEDITSYDSTYNSYYQNVKTGTNHAVCIVGWDDNFSKENFKTTAPGDGAWLIRNSWGSSGYDHYGYFWISYYDTSLRDYVFVYDFVSEDSDEYYDNNYQYDGGHVSDGSYGFGDLKNSATAANVFTCQNEKEELKAVMFGTDSANMNYNIKVYKGPFTENNPTSNTLLSEVSGAVLCEGMHTVKLSKPVTLYKGDVYSVVVTLTGEEASILFECSADYWFSSTVSGKSGQSYIYMENDDCWIDFATQQSEIGNFRIKAFTNTKQIGSGEPKQISISNVERTTEGYNKISFQGTQEATSYKIYRKTTGNYELLATISENNYTDTAIDANTSYTYKVNACNKNYDIDGAEYVFTPEIIPAVSIDYEYKDNGIFIKWNKLNNVDGYIVYRRNAGETTETKYVIPGASQQGFMDVISSDLIHKDFEYVVIGYKGNYFGTKTGWKTVKYHMAISFSEVAATCTEDGQKAGTRCPYCKNILTGGATISKLNHSMKYVEGVESTSSVNGYKSHYKCEKCNKYFSDEKGENEVTFESLQIEKKPEAVNISSVVRTKEGYNEINYSTAANIKGYKIYRKTTGDFSLIGTTTEKYFVDTDIDEEESYIYKIVTYNDTYEVEGGEFPFIPVIINAVAPTLELNNNGIKISWSKNSNVDGYFIIRKIEDNDEFIIKKIVGNEITSFVDDIDKQYVHKNVKYTIIGYKGNYTAKESMEGWSESMVYHTLVDYAEIPADCDNDGMTARSACSVCNQIFSGGQKIAKSHSLVYHAAKTATLTSFGNTIYYQCNKCNKYFKDNKGANEITLESTKTIFNIKNCSISVVNSMQYNGNVQKPRVVITYKGKELVSGKDYVLKCGAYINTGKYVATINGIGYCTGTVNFSYTISGTGYCGTNLKYSFDSNTGALTISGSGNMYNYTKLSPAPWFKYADKIKTVSITGANSIGNYAFYKCNNLTKVVSDSKLTIIGEYAFWYDEKLTVLTGTNNITRINKFAFDHCSRLVTVGSIYGKINVPKTTVISTNAFYKCTSVKAVVASDALTALGGYAFGGCKSMTAIIIGNKCTRIGEYTFAGCVSLVKVIGGAAVTSVGKCAFNLDSSLTTLGSTTGTVYLPKIQTIDQYAFNGCSSMKKFIAGSSLASIGCYAFANNKLLTAVYFKTNKLTRIGMKALDAIKSNAVIYVPKAKLSAYKTLLKNGGMAKTITVKGY